tara:strand:+ start:31 stop:171 length:141 start_codon:yes stop_codon:yes gene_type:complete
LSTKDSWNNEDRKFKIVTDANGIKKYCKFVVDLFFANTVNRYPVKQ